MDILLSTELQFLFENRVANLNKQQLVPEDIIAIVDELSARDMISKKVIGNSFSGQPINCLSLGYGPKKILLWTQMHGDESTATAAVLDIIHFLSAKLVTPLNVDWQSQLTLHIVPMLNPDGAQVGTRENAQGIDINRDAMALQTPEGRALEKVVTETQPDFAFNLHDQHDYYRCGPDGTSSTLAFLAPAFNSKKTIDPARQKAMALIGALQLLAKPLLPDNIARYDDEYSARSFGDRIAERGISTILIESGHYPLDPNRQVARAMNVFVLLHALELLCNEASWTDDKAIKALEQQYWEIPENQEYQLCDLLIKNLGFAKNTFTTDIAVRKQNRFEQSFFVADIGDLHQQYGLETIEALGYLYDPGRSYLLSEEIYLSNESYIALLKSGFSHFVGESHLIKNHSDYTVIENPKYWHDDLKMMKGVIPAGFLCKHGERKFAFIMGELVPL